MTKKFPKPKDKKTKDKPIKINTTFEEALKVMLTTKKPKKTPN